MESLGGEDERQVLDVGDTAGHFLERAITVLQADGTVDHLVGVAATLPVETWRTALESSDHGIESGRLIDCVEGEAAVSLEGLEGFDVQPGSTDALGDMGIAIIESLKDNVPDRPAIVIDSAAALGDDPGTRFKFLALLSHRLRRDDGYFLVSAGEAGLPEHEVHTLRDLFDSVTGEDEA